jgi:hypothetical protein
MSETPLVPTNTNLLHSNKFILSFARIPNVQYFTQGIPLPGISMGEGIRQTPFIDLFVPGDKLQYDALAITFLVDEDLKSWLEIHDWMRAMTFPVEFAEYARLGTMTPAHAKKIMPQYSDAALVILDSNQNSNFRVKFVNCFPTSLSSIQFSSTGGPAEVMTADATFRFDYYNVTLTH